MSIVEIAFVHTLSLERFKKNNYDGSKQFYKPEIIKCYREDKSKKVITKTGEEVVSGTSYFTTTPVGDQDKIDGLDVVSIETYNMLGIKYYRSYV